MPIKMKQLPISERPYEKLEMYGENTLSNAELLAIIIKSGTKEESSVTLAQKILSLFLFFLILVHSLLNLIHLVGFLLLFFAYQLESKFF